MTTIISHRLGTVTLEPTDPIIAGTIGQWTLLYTVGSYGIDEGGTIKLSQRFASDWEVPQFDQPSQAAFTSVTTSGQAKLRPYYHKKAHERPWMKCLVIDVYDGSLSPGDTVTITLGDQSQGSPGIRAQTFQETAHEFRLLIDPTNAIMAHPLPTSPKVPLIAGPPVILLCIIPTQAVIDQPLEIFIKGQDVWGNPTPVPNGLTLAWVGSSSAEAIIDNKQLIPQSAGYGYVMATLKTNLTQLSCRSNPLTIFAHEPRLKKYWGDLHAQSDATVGTGTEIEYFTFGRDVARLDFASHQGNDFQMTAEDWQRLNDTVRDFQQDGKFVVFPGYEWSANTPAGGDRNVFYLEEGQPIFRSSHWQIPETAADKHTPAHPADILFERIRQNVAADKVLLAAHVGGRYADIRQYFDQELGPLIELVSCWGIFEWLLWDAFDMGYIVGVMGNSDGHKGRPGAEGPGAGEFGINNGLTCVLAESLTREAIFAALKARRCYGTTGPRIDLTFEIEGNPMGAVIEGSPKPLVQAAVKGTAPIESLNLYQGQEIIKTVQPPAFATCGDSNQIRISWQGSRIRGRGRRVTWDGAIQLTGTTITSATTFAFDSAADGIVAQTPHEIIFKSGTTGDTDGLNLMLDQAQQGTIRFNSLVGSCQINLAELAPGKSCFDFGGLGIQVCFERYPILLTTFEIELTAEIKPPTGQLTPYFVKAIQSDGHIAWSSPIYVGNFN